MVRLKLTLAYLQGELKSSRVDVENYARIKAKGDKFGGLYIYRDNIRVLPYGDSDYDFLDIEKIVRNEHQHISFLIDECSVLLK